VAKNEEVKELVIMSGIPGSGKSSWHREAFPSAYVCSADNYHLYPYPEGLPEGPIEREYPVFTIDGKRFVYKYIPEEAKFAHQQCFANFLKGIQNGEKTIIIDNTNITVSQYENYMFIAQMNGYQVCVVQFISDSRDALRMCMKRQTHRVPEEVIHKMWWEHEHITSKFNTDNYEFDNIKLLFLDVINNATQV
jgi:predicted kinase